MENTMLTDDQIEEISKTVEDTLKENPNQKNMKQAKEEAIKDHKGEVGVATVITNPFTGKPMYIEDSENVQLQTFEEMLDDESIVPMDINSSKIVITEDKVKNQLITTFGNINISVEDINTIIDLANKVKNKEEFSYYMAMPQAIKDLINSTIGIEMGSKMGSFVKEGRNYVAGTILNNIVNDATQDVAFNDLQKSIAAIKHDSANKIKQDKYWSDYKRYLLFGTIEKADKLRQDGKEDKAKKYEEVHDAFIESYMMNDLIDLYSKGKIRVRKIDIEKFKKTCRSFNFKYRNSINIINDITQVLLILDRNVDKSYDIDIIKEFICIFIKYTDIKNMKADNIIDHVFMYNWIFNIISLDMYNKNDEFAVQFHDQLINNINNFLKIINDRKNKKG